MLSQRTRCIFIVLFLPLAGEALMASADSPFVGRTESWDYASAMKEVARKFTGTEGVVLHFGDSITVAAEYTAWGRHGRAKTPEDAI